MQSESLIHAGQVRTGIFAEPITSVRPGDFDLRTPMGGRRGGIARHFAYKQFHYLGGISSNLIFGAAIVDLRYMSTAFFYVYDLKSGREIRHTWRSPLSGAVQFSEDPETGSVSYGKTANGVSVRVEGGKRILSVRKAGREIITASFEDAAPAIEPLRICTRAGYTGWVYVRKTGGVRLTGRVTCELGEFDIADCLGHTDYSAGFMRPETWWNWAFISGVVDKKRFALNVSCGVNETSFSENCFWIDGRIHFLPQTIFEFDAKDPGKPWHVHSSALDVRFASRGVHTERVNAGILASRFSQFYGTFEGRLQLAGNQIPIQSLYGFAEDHYAKW